MCPSEENRPVAIHHWILREECAPSANSVLWWWAPWPHGEEDVNPTTLKIYCLFDGFAFRLKGRGVVYWKMRWKKYINPVTVWINRYYPIREESTGDNSDNAEKCRECQGLECVPPSGEKDANFLSPSGKRWRQCPSFGHAGGRQ